MSEKGMREGNRAGDGGGEEEEGGQTADRGEKANSLTKSAHGAAGCSQDRAVTQGPT